MTVAAGELRRQRTLGEILGVALALYRKHFVTFFAVSLAAVPFNAATLFVDLGLRGDPLLRVAASFIGLAVSLVLMAAQARAVADVAEGMRLSFRHVYRRVLGQLGLLLATGAQIVIAAFVLVLTVIGIPLAVYLLVRWAFVPQVIAIDSLSVEREMVRLDSPFVAASRRNRIVTAIERLAPAAARLSGKAVDRNWWRTFGALISISLPVFFINAVPSNIISFVVSRPLGSSLGLVAGTITVPFFGIALTLLFFDLQSRERERASIA
ncbi:MAG: hypothetical protein ABSC13_05855 [Dehalococcoidia bacterium]|jgi:hypothetical protein